MATRRFFFQTRQNARNTFRATGYAGLSDDQDGRSRIDRTSNCGYMAEWRVRKLLKELGMSPRSDTVEFSWAGHKGLSAAQLVRYLDNLTRNQCPACRAALTERSNNGIWQELSCNSCRFTERRRVDGRGKEY